MFESTSEVDSNTTEDFQSRLHLIFFTTSQLLAVSTSIQLTPLKSSPSCSTTESDPKRNHVLMKQYIGKRKFSDAQKDDAMTFMVIITSIIISEFV